MADLPLLENDLYSPYSSKGLEILAVCLDENKDRIVSTIAPFNLSYRILVDKDRTAARAYRVSAIPSNFVIDRGGVIRYRQTGYNMGAMRTLIATLL